LLFVIPYASYGNKLKMLTFSCELKHRRNQSISLPFDTIENLTEFIQLVEVGTAHKIRQTEIAYEIREIAYYST